jgi:hypothetical protein
MLFTRNMPSFININGFPGTGKLTIYRTRAPEAYTWV